MRYTIPDSCSCCNTKDLTLYKSLTCCLTEFIVVLPDSLTCYLTLLSIIYSQATYSDCTNGFPGVYLLNVNILFKIFHENGIEFESLKKQLRAT